MDRGFSWSGHPIGKYECSFCLSFFTYLLRALLLVRIKLYMMINNILSALFFLFLFFLLFVRLNLSVVYKPNPN
jgi:hypothetical protein